MPVIHAAERFHRTRTGIVIGLVNDARRSMAEEERADAALRAQREAADDACGPAPPHAPADAAPRLPRRRRMPKSCLLPMLLLLSAAVTVAAIYAIGRAPLGWLR